MNTLYDDYPSDCVTIPKALLERRASVRFPIDCGGACQPVKGDKDVHWPALVTDISTRGVGLVLQRRFEPGTLLSVDLQDDSGNLLRRIMVRTTHLTPGADKQWMVGCAFISRLGEADLRDLLKKMETDPASADTVLYQEIAAMADTHRGS